MKIRHLIKLKPIQWVSLPSNSTITSTNITFLQSKICHEIYYNIYQHKFSFISRLHSTHWMKRHQRHTMVKIKQLCEICLQSTSTPEKYHRSQHKVQKPGNPALCLKTKTQWRLTAWRKSASMRWCRNAPMPFAKACRLGHHSDSIIIWCGSEV